MNPVTPKVEVGKPIAMLRYAKQGETVISMQGSPVVATRYEHIFKPKNLIAFFGIFLSIFIKILLIFAFSSRRQFHEQ